MASRWILSSLAAVLFALIPLATSNAEGDALYALRRSLIDPENVLQSWDPTLVNPCTWFHVTCDHQNHVTRATFHELSAIDRNALLAPLQMLLYKSHGLTIGFAIYIDI